MDTNIAAVAVGENPTALFLLIINASPVLLTKRHRQLRVRARVMRGKGEPHTHLQSLLVGQCHEDTA